MIEDICLFLIGIDKKIDKYTIEIKFTLGIHSSMEMETLQFLLLKPCIFEYLSTDICK